MKVRVAHASLQFADTREQHAEDLEKIFKYLADHRVGWCTGTEAGDGAKNNAELIVRLAKKYGYNAWVPSLAHGDAGKTDCWIVVRADLISGDVKKGYDPVIPSSDELYKRAGSDAKLPRWGEKGVVSFSFECEKLQGHVTILASHHLTGAHHEGAADHGVNRWEWNEKLDDAIGKAMRKAAAGPDLAFAGFDRNESDRKDKVEVPGATSLGDELKRWQNSGHGDIDWIITFNKDKRVSAVKYEVLDDKEFKLHMDHFLVTGVVDVEPLKS